MHRLVLSVLLLSAFGAAALPAAAPPEVPPEEGALLLTGGTLVDPGSGTAAEGDLLIVDGVIVAVGRLRPEAFAGEVVDVSGRWIVPGLRDLQVHAFLNQAQATRLASVGKLAAAGVPIVAGTDSGNPWTVQGYSLHRELELLVAAGLTPRQALAAATTAAGELLGRSWGLAPGDEGSVLVLDASPLEDIRNTRRIHLVVHHGRVVDRDRLLAD